MCKWCDSGTEDVNHLLWDCQPACFAQNALNKWLEINFDVVTYFNIELCYEETDEKVLDWVEASD